MRFLLPLLVALAPAGLCGQEVLDRLAAWIDRARAVPRAIDERRLEDLETMLTEVRRLREPVRTALELARLAALAERVEGNATLATATRLAREDLERRLAAPDGAR